VPFHLIDEDHYGLKLREAEHWKTWRRSMLGLLGIEKPAEMTGRDLRDSVDLFPGHLVALIDLSNRISPSPLHGLFQAFIIN
jgi:hypothetical protein